jgi:hypothetical protein
MESPEPPRVREHPEDYSAEANITEAGLPALTGTEAEIAAAGPIRHAILMRADDEMSEIRATERLYELPSPTPPRGLPLLEAALHRLRHQTGAAWWIAHRDDDLRSLLTTFMQELEAENA